MKALKKGMLVSAITSALLAASMMTAMADPLATLETSEETIISSDGNILVRRYDHHGANGHYRIVERGRGMVDIDKAEHLRMQLMELLQNHSGYCLNADIDSEVIMEEPGIRISVDAGIANKGDSFDTVLNAFLETVDINYTPVVPK